MPKTPFSEELPADADRLGAGAAPEAVALAQAFFQPRRADRAEAREIERDLAPEPRPPAFYIWFRASAPLPPDRLIHQGVLAYASDMTLLDTSLVAHGRSLSEKEIQAATHPATPPAALTAHEIGRMPPT
jgi:acyl-CoA thioesterase-2